MIHEDAPLALWALLLCITHFSVHLTHLLYINTQYSNHLNAIRLNTFPRKICLFSLFSGEMRCIGAISDAIFATSGFRILYDNAIVE